MSNTDWLDNILTDMTHPSRDITTDKHREIARNQAKQAILDHINKAIGEDDERTNANYGKDYYADVRNQLRAEIRKELGL